MVRKIEALADAITKSTGYLNPENELYSSRNPIGLPAVSPKHVRDSRGKRVFHSVLDGYQAALFDLELKCSGKSKAKLKPNATLRDLMVVYGYPEAMGDVCSKFLRKALGDPTIKGTTPLSFFVE